MHEVATETPTPEFTSMWAAAGRHLQARIADSALPFAWLKARLEPPFLEHLSFRLGNQLFFVRIEDKSHAVASPGSKLGVERIATGCSGHATLLQMQQREDTWTVAGSNWGLTETDSGRLIKPESLVSDEPIEMTDWELHDFAVGVVRNHLEKGGKQIMSSQGDPEVDPSIWFTDGEQPHWVVVRAARYPERSAARPSNIVEIKAQCAQLSHLGYFASVSAANSNDSFDGDNVRPLNRGNAMYVSFSGLEAIGH